MEVGEKGFQFHKMAQSYFVAAIRLLELEKNTADVELSMPISPFEISFFPGRDNNPFHQAPTLSMIRLGLELMLKSIHFNVNFCGFETPIFQDIERTHDLKKLYEQLLDVSPKIDGFESVNGRHTEIHYKAFIQLLASFSTYDPKGDMFRFGLTKGGCKLRIFENFSDEGVADAYILMIHKANEYMCRINSFLEHYRERAVPKTK
ncbi:hypothetical protein IPG41_05325 [Candidatus Peregrinibacteria bacterium]|nr:MAG: hypothetical protein IPG41_05325 [Candidatus Peregrinibacteria bacterium]